MLQNDAGRSISSSVAPRDTNCAGLSFHVAKNGPNLKEAMGDIEPPTRTPGIGIHGKISLDALA
jgi:hypothetical protein